MAPALPIIATGFAAFSAHEALAGVSPRLGALPHELASPAKSGGAAFSGRTTRHSGQEDRRVSAVLGRDLSQARGRSRVAPGPCLASAGNGRMADRPQDQVAIENVGAVFHAATIPQNSRAVALRNAGIAQ